MNSLYLDLEELKKYANPRQVLKFDFSTDLLFRCTQRKYANDFKNGRLRFNQPKYWINAEENGNKGLGDSLEGIFLVTDINDSSDFIKSLRKDKNIECFEKNNKLYFRKKSIKELYCFCLYGLNSNSFTEKNIDRFGREYYVSRIDNKYFSEFSDVSEDEYFKLLENERPCVIFINNPHLFFEKIRNFFIKLGVKNDEIIISPIQYLNYDENLVHLIPYPKELLLKDSYYSNQSEIRIIINSNEERFIKYMSDNKNIIDIGSLVNQVDIYDYYFHDLLLTKEGNVLNFTLPFPIEVKLSDMTLREILKIFIQILRDEMPYEMSLEKRREQMDDIKKIIYDKYHFNLLVEDGRLVVRDYNGNIEDILDT